MTFDFNKLVTIGFDKWKTAPFRFYGEKEPFFIGNKIEQDWRDIILSGTTALTLVNAKADSLEYLKLFGGTEQLPETYLDTVTLSGGCEQRNLPSGFTQVEYLEIATEGAYFSTGINATVNTDMGITASNITSNSAQILVAQCESGSDYFRIAKAGASQRVIGSLGSSTVTDNNSDGTDKFTARMNKSGFYVNGSLVGTFSNIPSSLTGVGEIEIFRGKYSDSIYFAYAGSRFNSVWIDDNIFFPCRRNSDNQLGIYNTKTREFILPSGEGSFTAGADVTTPTPDTPIDIVCNNGAIKVIHNLIDLNAVTDGYYYDPQGVYSASSTSRLTGYIPIVAGQSVTVYFKSLAPNSNLNVRINIFNSNKVWQSQEVLALEPSAEGTKIITPTANGYIRVSGNYTGANVDWNTAKVVYGEYTVATIDSAIGTIYTDGTQEVVTDILGNTASAERLLAVGDYKDTQEVLSGNVTRNIGIKVLDGTEDWVYAEISQLFFVDGVVQALDETHTCYCSHYLGTPTNKTATSGSNKIKVGSNVTTTPSWNRVYIYANIVDYPTVEDFKAFLASQYANGNPVIVVYPTSSATTESVSGQFLSKSPVTQTAGSISNLPIATTESAHTVPTPQQPLQINCNNGVVKVSKNLFDMATVTNGYYISATGEIVENEASMYSDYIKVKPSTTYTISLVSGFQGNFIRVHSYTANKTWIEQVSAEATDVVGSSFSATFTTSSNAEYIRFGCRQAQTNIQVEQGATATSYMPYGQVYTDGTTETVEITGKNLFDTTSIINGYRLSNTLNSTYNSSPDKAVANGYFISNLIPVEVGKTYIKNSPVVDVGHRLKIYDSSKVGVRLVDSSNEVTIQPGEAYIVFCGLQTEFTTAYCGELLGTATAQPLYKVGTYQDVQSVIDGGVTRNVGVKVLDGTEDWTQVSGSSAPFALVVNDFVSATLGDKILVYSTHFQGVPAAATWSNYENLISFTAATSPTAEKRTFRVRYLSNTKTLAEFKQFLAEQYANGTPVICVYYKTATTETVTPQPMNIQAGTNIVEITQASMDNLELEVKYKAGVAVTIEEIENAQLDNNVEVIING